MTLALATAAVVLVVLALELVRPDIVRVLAGLREQRELRRRLRLQGSSYDPGRERRAEQRARELLRSCVEEHEWEMYRDLGLLRVHGTLTEGSRAPGSGENGRYAYLIYPHKPIVAYVPATGELLNEYCVQFPDHTRPYGSARLPDADDVLAKWMALAADERALIGEANMHLPGRQVDPERVRRDLARLARWDGERSRTRGAAQRAGAVRPPSVAAPRLPAADNVRAA
jgi:hypothetical protein